jgi:hypothetical protein
MERGACADSLSPPPPRGGDFNGQVRLAIGNSNLGGGLQIANRPKQNAKNENALGVPVPVLNARVSQVQGPSSKVGGTRYSSRTTGGWWAEWELIANLAAAICNLVTS